jgi:8-oxo-dGTP pyrophosphatase MutT (NUDIX family)
VKWTVYGERSIYDSPWVGLALVDVDVPGHGRIDHHVVRVPFHAAGTVVLDDQRGVLLLWRHRFITDTWGWEIPAGRVEAGEAAMQAAAREVLEETGWRPRGLRPLTSYRPSNGLSDQVFHLFAAAGADYVGDPTDPSESERIEWRSLTDVRAAIAAHEVTDGLSLTALLWVLAAPA